MSRKRNNTVKFFLVFFLGISITLVFCSSEAEAAARDNFSFTFSLFYSGNPKSLINIDGIGISSQKTTDKKTDSKTDKNGKSEKKDDLNDHKNSTSRRRAIIID